MEKYSDATRSGECSDGPARQFLKIFGCLLLVVAGLVACINLVSYHFMSRPENQRIVQLMSGWGRMYKPILYDAQQPEILVLGASWARDAFDPIDTSYLLGQTLFNHAVSGATDYETRRFADAALDNPELQSAIINLNTFYRDKVVAQTRYGFDESILDVDQDLNPRYWVEIKRLYSLALTGWAVGANLKLLFAVHSRDNNVQVYDYLEAYEHADFSRKAELMSRLRKQIFPPLHNANRKLNQRLLPIASPSRPQQLDIILDRFCARGVDIYLYFTPSHVRQQSCDPEARKKRDILAYLKNKQSACLSRLHYYDFSYPNAMTLEGVLAPIKSSQYYRPDGHPRPIVGTIISARMFDRDFPEETPSLLTNDFGTDLLNHSSPDRWLTERAGRCQGNWVAQSGEPFRKSLITDKSVQLPAACGSICSGGELLSETIAIKR